MQPHDEKYRETTQGLASLSGADLQDAISAINKELAQEVPAAELKQFITKVLPNPSNPQVWGIERNRVTAIAQQIAQLDNGALNRIATSFAGVVQVPQQQFLELFKQPPEFGAMTSKP